MKLKEKYEEELQNLKKQLQEVRGTLKIREKLIKRLFKVLHRQEIRISTVDYTPFNEFEKPENISVQEVCEARIKMLRHYLEPDLIEMTIDEYTTFKRRLYEAEIKTNLLEQQVALLKSDAFKSFGNLTQYIEKKQVEAVMKETDSKELTSNEASKIVQEKREQIKTRRHTTYLDSIVLKGLQPLINEADKGLVASMLTKGIAPRPEKEIMYELKVLEDLKHKVV